MKTRGSIRRNEMSDAFVAYASTSAQIKSLQPQQPLTHDGDNKSNKQKVNAAAHARDANMLQMSTAYNLADVSDVEIRDVTAAAEVQL